MHPRREPNRERPSRTQSLRIGDAKIYIVTGEFDDGTLAEVFLKFAKQGSTLNGMAAWVGATLSLALQHGVPLVDLAGVPIQELRFEPEGITNDPEIGHAYSLADAVMRRLVLSYCTPEEQAQLGIV